jgi:bifunctional non-homologous end joining protein LigD
LPIVAPAAFGIRQRLVRFVSPLEFNRGGASADVWVAAARSRAKGAADRLLVSVLRNTEHNVVARNGFTPVTRAQLLKKFKGLEISECPFANLPEARSGRWGQGLTKAKMAECQWLKPVLVGQFEFLEWTGDNHLRHSKFVGLREDKKPSDVVRE